MKNSKFRQKQYENKILLYGLYTAPKPFSLLKNYFVILQYISANYQCHSVCANDEQNYDFIFWKIFPYNLLFF